MKKFLMIAVMMLMSMGAFAQERGKLALGVTLSEYFISGDSHFGIGAKGQYCLTSKFRAEVDVKFYPKKDANMVNPTFDLQYLFPIGDSEKLFVYPLAGVGLLTATDSSLETISMVCYKGGIGAELYFSKKFKFLAETYYQIAKKDDYKFTYPIVSLGAAYCF